MIMDTREIINKIGKDPGLVKKAKTITDLVFSENKKHIFKEGANQSGEIEKLINEFKTELETKKIIPITDLNEKQIYETFVAPVIALLTR